MHIISKLIITILFIISTIDSSHAFQYTNTAYNYRQVPDSLNQLKNIGNKYYNEENYEQAISAFLKLIDNCFDLGYEKYTIDLYEYILDLIASRKDISLNTKIQQIATYCDSEQRVNLQAVKYSYWAQAYLNNNAIDSAMFYYHLAIKHCNADQLWLVSTNLNIGFSFIYYHLNNLKKTLEYTKKAEKITEEKLIPNNIEPPYNLYVMQGIIYRLLGYKEKAINSDIKIIKLQKEDNSTHPSILSDKYQSLAIQYDELGDFDNAIIYYKKCIKIAKKYNLDVFLGVYYPTYCIASSYEEQGMVKEAKKIYKKLVLKLEQTKKTSSNLYPVLIQSYQGLAELYKKNKTYDSTKYYLNKLRKIHKKNQYKSYKTDIISSQYNIILKNYPLAERQAYNALASIKNSANTNISYPTTLIYNALYQISIEQQDYNKALSYCQKSLCIQAPNFSEENLYKNPSFEQVFHKRGLINTVKFKLKVLEVLYAQKNPNVTPQLILSTIKLGIEALEYKNKNFKSKSSQTYWLNQKAIPLFEKAIKITLQLYERTEDEQYLNEAFMLSERSKSMMMMNALQEQNATSFGGIPKKEIELEQELERELKVIEKAKQDAEMSKDSVEMHYQDSLLFVYHHKKTTLLERFERDYPKYFELKHAVHHTSIQQVQNALDEQTFLIEYFQGQEQIYVFTISKEKAFVNSFKHNKAYDVQLASFQNLLIDLKRANQNINRTYRSFVKSSYDLYQLLLEKSLIKGKKRLMLIPDGQLAYLPFEVLISEELASAANTTKEHLEFSNLPYLLREYTTNYNYSAQLFLQQCKQPPKNRGCEILALAPSYSNKTAPNWRNPYEQKIRQELPELPGAIRELDFLKGLFRGTFLYNKAANETNFKEKAPNFSILHLAVHGLVDQEKPELSGLALEEDNCREEDNILYAYEIKQLDLEAQLVVLSACETGIGKYQRGEGVMSIGRGFMYAGVPSLMTTLWSLNDYSSSIIIKEFYQNLQDGMPKDKALRQAKLHYLDNYNGVASHPALWACFIQVGDYAPLVIETNDQQWYYAIAAVLALLSSIVIFIKTRKK